MVYMTTKEIEEAIRKAFEIDRILPSGKPKSSGCLLGRLTVIPDDLRPLDDIIEDAANNWHNLSKEDLRLWYEVMSLWIPYLSNPHKEVVKKRCSGKGWKRVARELYESGLSERTLDRTTLWRIFQRGLDDILRKLTTF